MALKILFGSRDYVNRKLILHASKNLPSLIIDCANCADPHKFQLDEHQLSKMYVFELELLYKFRDVLLKVPEIAKQLKIKSIVVTTPDHLFNYQDEIENKNIYEHAWELMTEIGKKYEIIVGNGPHCYKSKDDSR